MKGFDEYENYIDEFYGESEGEIKNLKFNEKLTKTSKKLDILNEDIFDFDIDTIKIIETAEKIKEARGFKIELTFFLGAGISILGLYGFLGLRLGYRFILASQIILMAMMPWVIVPIAVKRKRGSEI